MNTTEENQEEQQLQKHRSASTSMGSHIEVSSNSILSKEICSKHKEDGSGEVETKVSEDPNEEEEEKGGEGLMSSIVYSKRDTVPSSHGTEVDAEDDKEKVVSPTYPIIGDLTTSSAEEEVESDSISRRDSGVKDTVEHEEEQDQEGSIQANKVDKVASWCGICNDSKAVTSDREQKMLACSSNRHKENEGNNMLESVKQQEEESYFFVDDAAKRTIGEVQLSAVASSNTGASSPALRSAEEEEQDAAVQVNVSSFSDRKEENIIKSIHPIKCLESFELLSESSPSNSIYVHAQDHRDDNEGQDASYVNKDRIGGGDDMNVSSSKDLHLTIEAESIKSTDSTGQHNCVTVSDILGSSSDSSFVNDLSDCINENDKNDDILTVLDIEPKVNRSDEVSKESPSQGHGHKFEGAELKMMHHDGDQQQMPFDKISEADKEMEEMAFQELEANLYNLTHQNSGPPLDNPAADNNKAKAGTGAATTKATAIAAAKGNYMDEFDDSDDMLQNLQTTITNLKVAFDEVKDDILFSFKEEKEFECSFLNNTLDGVKKLLERQEKRNILETALSLSNEFTFHYRHKFHTHRTRSTIMVEKILKRFILGMNYKLPSDVFVGITYNHKSRVQFRTKLQEQLKILLGHEPVVKKKEDGKYYISYNE